MSNLPQGWAEVPFGEIGDWGGGGTPSKSRPDFWDGGNIPWVSPKDMKSSLISTSADKITEKAIEESSARIVPQNSILIVTRSGILNHSVPVALTSVPVTINQDIKSISPYEFVSPEFLLVALKRMEAKILTNCRKSGTTVESLVTRKLKDLLIPLPPRPEQSRIVRKVDTLNVRANRIRTGLDAIPELIERYKFTFLRSAFRGEQSAQFREENDLESVSDLLKKLAPPEQGRGGRKPTGEIRPGTGAVSINNPRTKLPDGWDWVPLLRIARQETGHTPSRAHPEWWGGEIPWISIPDANTHHGRIIHDTVQKINKDGLANSSARLLPKGTVVLSRTASVGYVTILGREMATSQDFVTWTCSEAIEPKYLMYALMSEGSKIRDFGEGTTHTTIYFPEIRALNIKLAPIKEQRELVRRIDLAFEKMDSVAEKVEETLRLTGRLDRLILERAVAGELVPPNLSDEPIDELLTRVRDSHASLPKPHSPRRKKAKVMKKDPKELLLTDSASWPNAGLPFDDVAKRVLLPYGELRDAVFALMDGTSGQLQQSYDTKNKVMRIKRASR